MGVITMIQVTDSVVKSQNITTVHFLQYCDNTYTVFHGPHSNSIHVFRLQLLCRTCFLWRFVNKLLTKNVYSEQEIAYTRRCSVRMWRERQEEYKAIQHKTLSRFIQVSKCPGCWVESDTKVTESEMMLWNITINAALSNTIWHCVILEPYIL